MFVTFPNQSTLRREAALRVVGMAGAARTLSDGQEESGVGSGEIGNFR
jgi:hypothetical protein